MVTINSDLTKCDLLVDAIYDRGRLGHAGDDPLSQLLNVSNSGGFRYRGSLDHDVLSLLVLTTNMREADWPDALDPETGVFTYFGDNRKPGRELHDTPRHGNEVLRRVFNLAHGGEADRARVPPVFVFRTGAWRAVQFLGLAVPGATTVRPLEDLVAVWKTRDGLRFQNYRATFTILDEPRISRSWLDAVIDGTPFVDSAPKTWLEWQRRGTYRPLISERAVQHRSRSEQLPSDDVGKRMIVAIHTHFTDDPHSFEHCAAEIAKLTLPAGAHLDVTRPSRDGGRDAIGKVPLGKGPGSIMVDFALEAKCYGFSNSVGVRDLSRLISRLRHRQFGVLVTTSYVDAQAYREIKEDQHPVVIIAAADIVALLREHGITTVARVVDWLGRNFPISSRSGSDAAA